MRRSLEAWNRRELSAWLALFRSDAEIDWSRSRAPFKGVYRGQAELKAFWEDFADAWDEFRIELDDLHDFGDGRVLAEMRTVGRGRGSGIEVTAIGGTIIWTIRNGKIAHGKLFQSKEEALEAAGLRE